MFNAMLTQFNGFETEVHDLGILGSEANTVRKAMKIAADKAKELDGGWSWARVFDNVGLLAICNLSINAQYEEPKFIQMIGNDLIGVDTEIVIDENFIASFGVEISPFMVGVEFFFNDGGDFSVLINSAEKNLQSECKKWALSAKANGIKRITANKLTLQTIGLIPYV